jgi:hypothetical protein
MNSVRKQSLLSAWHEKLTILRRQVKLIGQGVDGGSYVLLLPVCAKR